MDWNRLDRLFRNSRIRWVAAANFTLAVLIAAALTPRIGRSKIDVGLDLVEEDDAVAGAGSAPGQSPPQPLFDRNYYFELTATGEKDPRSKGAEVWLNDFPFQERLRHDPPNSWVLRGKSVTPAGPGRAALRWDGPLDCPLIVLGKHDFSGIARLKTSAGEQTIDLYDPAGGFVIVPIPPAEPAGPARAAPGAPSRARNLVLSWGEAGGARAAMDRIPDDHGPGEAYSKFELIATGLKNSDSKGREVWITEFRSPSALKQAPPQSWQFVKPSLVSRDRLFPRVSWAGVSNQVTISLLKHPWSGIAMLRTSAGDQLIDLYDPEGNKTVVLAIPPCDRPVKRYRASIPRRALGGFQIHFGEARGFQIRRLYIGSFWPTVFLSSAPKAEEDIWGRVAAPWKPAVQQGQLAVPSLSRVEQGGWATFGVLALVFFLVGLGLAWLTLLICRVARWLVREPAPAPRTLAPFRFRAFAALWVPLLAVWLLNWLCFFPATMETDSCHQWHQAKTMRINDWHPPFHTLTMKLASMAWDSPGSLIAVHIAALSLCLAYGYSLLLRAGVPRWLAIGAYAVGLVSPRNAMMAVLMEKDVLYTVFVFLFTCLAGHCLLDRRIGKSRLYWIGLGGCLGLIPLYRHNGILILAAMLPLLPIFLWPWKRFVVLALAVSLLVLGGVRWILFPALRIEHVKGLWPVIYGVTEIAPLVAQDAPFSREEYEFLCRVRPMIDRWDYSPVTSIVALYQFTDLPFAEANSARLMRLCASLMTRYPGLLSWHHLLAAAYIFNPMEAARYPVEYPYAEYFGGVIRPNAWADMHGLAMHPVFPKANGAILDFLGILAQRPLNWLFFRTAVPLYAVLLASVICVVRLADWRLLLVYLPALLNTAGLALGSPAQISRYQFPLTFAAGFLVCWAFLPKDNTPRRPV